MSSTLTKILLVLALLFAQMGSLTHGISHTLFEHKQNQEQSLSHGKHCDLCGAYAQIGSAASSTGISLFSCTSIAALAPVYHVIERSPTFVVFAARAPPYSA
jgi:hypothetical protein